MVSFTGCFTFALPRAPFAQDSYKVKIPEEQKAAATGNRGCLLILGSPEIPDLRRASLCEELSKILLAITFLFLSLSAVLSCTNKEVMAL